jgi:hypothetical protein
VKSKNVVVMKRTVTALHLVTCSGLCAFTCFNACIVPWNCTTVNVVISIAFTVNVVICIAFTVNVVICIAFASASHVYRYFRIHVASRLKAVFFV